MVLRHPEAWIAPDSLVAAARAQHEIAAACETRDRLDSAAGIAGADTSCEWRDGRGPIHAAIAPIAWPSGLPREAASASLVPPMPYIPGYLGFREVPALIAAWERLADKPGLLLVDGHGRAHPRRCGIATHIGVLLDVPAIGVAKSLLCGTIAGEVGPRAGDRAPIVDRGEVIGMALRTSPRGTPVHVGIGHRVSLETAVAWVLRLTRGRRLPLPIRLAHDGANIARRAYEGSALATLL